MLCVKSTCLDSMCVTMTEQITGLHELTEFLSNAYFIMYNDDLKVSLDKGGKQKKKITLG